MQYTENIAESARSGMGILAGSIKDRVTRFDNVAELAELARVTRNDVQRSLCDMPSKQ